MLKATEGKLPGIVLFAPRIFRDERGHFLEIYRGERYSIPGLPAAFVQDNISRSGRNVLRGLHYQVGRFPQGKLITVLEGCIWDVAVDIRRGSPTFGRFAAETLSSEDYRQVYIPEGFAHGFCVLGDKALVLYKATNRHAPEEERGILWSDPRLGIDWPVKNPVMSEKDRKLPLLSAVDPDDLPLYEA